MAFVTFHSNLKYELVFYLPGQCTSPNALISHNLKFISRLFFSAAMRKYCLLFPLLVCFFAGLAQQKISGRVLDKETGDAISFASVVYGKGQGIITDTAGKFSFTLRRQIRQNDSLQVSAIGFRTEKISIKDVPGSGNIQLTQTGQLLQQVKVFASLKGDYRRFGYYRGWNVKNEGGEIGYIFELPRKKFQLGLVQVKINHNYDTCWLKLHLRDVAAGGLGLPENEVLKSETVLPATIQYGLVEFDLGWRHISLPTSRLYVGFELLRCGCSQSAAPSFFFMGNEEGQNFYKETEKEVWKRSGDYTIYIRMLVK